MPIHHFLYLNDLSEKIQNFPPTLIVTRNYIKEKNEIDEEAGGLKHSSVLSVIVLSGEGQASFP